tara:strand:+ start:845 stop:1954 length:1110 start_codon:yes stop_codon:yes gene_type:complete
MISVFQPRLTIRDKLSVLNSLLKNEISGTSPIVKEFEQNTSSEFDRKYGVGVSNGSVALDLAFQLLDLEEKDEVILPSFTIISTLAAVIRSGATPVFCDVDEDSWNMTVENVDKYINENTKAVLLVHTYGLPADAENLQKLCDEKSIVLIEDAAEAHGQSLNDIKCGSFGLISTMSFYANKHITTGEGGMILTDNKEIYENALKMRNLDFSQKRFQHNNLYWNYRLGGLQAALGNSQLSGIKKVIEHKRVQGLIYNQLFKEHHDIIQVPLDSWNNSKNHYWVYGIVLKKEGIRDKIIEGLYNAGIETRPFFYPLHLQNALPKEFKKDISLLVTENLGVNGLYLPLGSHVNKRNQKFIAETLITLINSYS